MEEANTTVDADITLYAYNQVGSNSQQSKREGVGDPHTPPPLLHTHERGRERERERERDRERERV